MYRYLLTLTVTSAVCLQGWRILFNNFVVDFVGLSGFHVGIIQSVREIPGFLALCAIFLFYLMREHKLSALSVTLLGLGTALTGFFPSFVGVLLTTLLMSLGFHYFETTNHSLTLQYFDEHEAPMVMGIQRSLSAASSIGVGILIFSFSSVLSYRNLYLIVGLVGIIIGLWAFTQEPTDCNKPAQHKKMVFRRKYSLFYLLTILAGARRQIFMVFSVFLIVKKFKFTVRQITILFVINNIINYFICPLIAKAIRHFGEKKVLFLEYSSLFIVFTAYAFVESKIIVTFLYILDHIFFNFAMAINTYFQKIADPQDIAPSMAVSFTINHIAAIVLPTVGGFLWIINYRIPFIAGAFLSLCSLLAVSQMVLPCSA